MSNRIAYVNGDFVPHEEARISIFDRGFLFADAIYEASGVLNGRLVDNELHLARLKRSAGEIALELPAPIDRIEAIQKELISRNELVEGVVYFQVTRGVAERNFVFPADTPPTLVMFTQAQDLVDAPSARAGIRVKSVPDLRWARRDIKTVNLLAQVLARQAAFEAGCQEAFMIDEKGMVTEGAASTALIITHDNKIVTRGRSQETLSGCTQLSLRRLIDEHGLAFEERPFSLEEALSAKEAFITNASAFVTPVISIDETVYGGGFPGPLTRRLRELYLAAAQA